MIKLFVATILLLNAFAVMAAPCAQVDLKKGNKGFLEWSDASSKAKIESHILKNFDLELGEKCPSIPVTISCTDSDHCTSFCIASSVTEHGEHANAVYQIDRCADDKIKTLKFISED